MCVASNSRPSYVVIESHYLFKVICTMLVCLLIQNITWYEIAFPLFMCALRRMCAFELMDSKLWHFNCIAVGHRLTMFLMDSAH